MFYLFSKRLFPIACLIVLFSCTPKSNELSVHDQLHRIFEEEQHFQAQESPFRGTSEDEDVEIGRLPEVNEKAQARRAAFYENLLNKLKEIDSTQLSKTDLINYRMFAFILQDRIDDFRFNTYMIPMNAEGGFYTSLPGLVQRMDFDQSSDYEDYLDRLKQFPRYIQEQINLMRKGIELGVVPPKIMLNGHDDFIQAHIHDDPKDHSCYKPFKSMSATVSPTDQLEWQRRAEMIIKDSVIGSYKELNDFMVDEYIPAARDKIGISEIPNGREVYKQRVRYFTTLEYSPEEIFAIGESEVKRIKAEMKDIIDSLEFKGSFADFLYFLRTDPQFYAKTPRELLMEASYITKKIDGKLPMLFGHLPRNSYGVLPVPDIIAPKYTGGRYVPGSYKGHRSGTYWVNTFKLESRPLYVLPALSLHEAVPGHHLQGSIAQEMEDVPAFRRSTYLSCYGEGWALYAELLGKEMGIYETPYEEFGRLTYEMWRACRLVVDVGIHYKDWTRQQAVDFMASNTALSLHEVNTEIDRYIGWPGQAISYKIGELKIRELRERAEKALGKEFDIREFHQVILENGSVPLFILEEMVDDYLSSKLAESKTL